MINTVLKSFVVLIWLGKDPDSNILLAWCRWKFEAKFIVFISSVLTSGPSLCHGPKRFFPQHSLEPDKLGLDDAKTSSKMAPCGAITMPPMMLMWLIEAQGVWTSPTPSCHFFSPSHLANLSLFLPLWQGELNVGQHQCSVWQGRGISKFSKFSHHITKLKFNSLGALLIPESTKPRTWSFSAQTSAVELFIFG